MTMYASVVDCQVLLHLHRSIWLVKDPEEDPYGLSEVFAVGGTVEAASAEYLRVAVEVVFVGLTVFIAEELDQPIEVILPVASVTAAQVMGEPDHEEEDEDEEEEDVPPPKKAPKKTRRR